MDWITISGINSNVMNTANRVVCMLIYETFRLKKLMNMNGVKKQNIAAEVIIPLSNCTVTFKIFC